jgi:hypothetical protein
MFHVDKVLKRKIDAFTGAACERKQRIASKVRACQYCRYPEVIYQGFVVYRIKSIMLHAARSPLQHR